MKRLGTWTVAGNAAVIILPFVGLLIAIVWFWHSSFQALNLAMLLGGYVLTVLGVTVGYHRLFTHKSFKTNKAVTAALGVLGSMAIEGPILQWVATHRMHHQHADQAQDPHSPHLHGHGVKAWLLGMYHAHLGWFFTPAPSREMMNRYVPDLYNDPLVRRLSRLFGVWAALGMVIPGLIGLLVTQTWHGALTGFIWGGLVRVFLVHHVTFSVNSVCHIWGSRPFQTHDQSRNNALFALLALGEGWHNNHHAFPSSARQGLAWWQVDISYAVIRLLGQLGLAHDIKVVSRDRMAAKRTQRGPASVPDRPSVPD